LGALNLDIDTALTGDSTPSDAPLTPEELAASFPQLEILSCLGRGGMGVVYQARQKSLGRLVALKLLAPERALNPQFAERFESEARALAALNHPHIVGVHDFGQAGGFYFLIMEFVDGLNLRQLMKARKLSPQEALSIVPPVCEALQYAHDQGIVHRDIKPENLMLDKAGRVKIADFGIAKMLHAPTPEAGLPAGTPHYMAPEQKDSAADHRADIYSLGVVLYELLTGELPAARLQPPSKKVSIDVRLDEIVLRALEIKPELRFQSAADLRTQVETVLTSPVPAGKTPALTVQKGLLIAVAAVLGLFALLHLLTPAAPTPQPRHRVLTAQTETADFNTGALADAFVENIVFGDTPYALAPKGLSGTPSVNPADTPGSEGTLVFKDKTYHLTELNALEVSTHFKWKIPATTTQALCLGLTGTSLGQLSGIKDGAFVGVRMKAQAESRAVVFSFDSKADQNVGVAHGRPSPSIDLIEAQWYYLRVTFSRVDAHSLRASASLWQSSPAGEIGEKLCILEPRNYGPPGFDVTDIVGGDPVWAALRASGTGGTDLIDDFQISAHVETIGDPTSTSQNSSIDVHLHTAPTPHHHSFECIDP
jgi:serine/threonine protein kinase